MVDDFLEEPLAQFDFTLPQRGLVGVALVPPKLAPVGYQRTHAGFAALILVDQLDVSTEEPLHLVAQPRPSNPTLHAVPPMPFLPLLL